MLLQWDDETLEPTRLAGFDMSEPTARNQVRAVPNFDAMPQTLGPDPANLAVGTPCRSKVTCSYTPPP